MAWVLVALSVLIFGANLVAGRGGGKPVLFVGGLCFAVGGGMLWGASAVAAGMLLDGGWRWLLFRAATEVFWGAAMD